MQKEEKLRSLYKKYKELNIENQLDYNKFYMYSLITHSTAIEGSTITEIENQLLFDEDISPHGRSMTEQLMNLDLKNAYEKSIQHATTKTDFTIDSLKELCALVLKNTGTEYNTIAGKFSSTNGDLRLLNVTASPQGASYMNYEKVPEKLESFCKELNNKRKSIAPNDIVAIYSLSFEAHYQLVTIHPWADGNGRMARLLMNQIQFEFNIAPSYIDKSKKAQYIEALVETRKTKDLTIIVNFMLDEQIANLETIISNYCSE